jgi:hypothetical protein
MAQAKQRGWPSQIFWSSSGVGLSSLINCPRVSRANDSLSGHADPAVVFPCGADPAVVFPCGAVVLVVVVVAVVFIVCADVCSANVMVVAAMNIVTRIRILVVAVHIFMDLEIKYDLKCISSLFS